MTKNTTKSNVSLKVLIITWGLFFIYAVVFEHFKLVCLRICVSRCFYLSGECITREFVVFYRKYYRKRLTTMKHLGLKLPKL